MASIPLPALTINPGKDYNPGRILQLKSLIQQQQFNQQEHPIQLQQQQLAVQQQQQELKDKQAVTKSMLGWDGKDPNVLQQSILTNGGSGNAALGTAAHFLGLRKDTAEAIKNEGQAALNQANAKKQQFEPSGRAFSVSH